MLTRWIHSDRLFFVYFRLIVAPPFQGHSAVSSAELEKFWTGRSYLPWKNVLNLPLVSRAGNSGESIRNLKLLLTKAGFYRGPSTELFDEAMLVSVKRFQAAQGIEVDGVVGGRTLLLLYRAGGTVEVPRLVQKGEEGDRAFMSEREKRPDRRSAVFILFFQ
jgi:hypothetical protein